MTKPEFPLYYYKAIALHVIDGDTVKLRIDRGFREFWEVNARLAFINAPELSTGDPGQASKAYLYNALFATAGTDPAPPIARQLWIRSETLDNYGRPLVTIWIEPTTEPPLNTSINWQMWQAGYAKPYGNEFKP